MTGKQADSGRVAASTLPSVLCCLISETWATLAGVPSRVGHGFLPQIKNNKPYCVRPLGRTESRRNPETTGYVNLSAPNQRNGLKPSLFFYTQNILLS